MDDKQDIFNLEIVLNENNKVHKKVNIFNILFLQQNLILKNKNPIFQNLKVEAELKDLEILAMIKVRENLFKDKN